MLSRFGVRMNLLEDPSVRVSSKGAERLAQPWASPMITMKLGFLDSSATTVVRARRMQSGATFFMPYFEEHRGVDKVSKILPQKTVPSESNNKKTGFLTG